MFRKVICSSSISLEARLKVAYLRARATFTHEAALRSFSTSIELEPQTTVAEVFARVERGEVEHGVRLPVENSMEGTVTHTLDELMNSPLNLRGDLPAVSELDLSGTVDGEGGDWCARIRWPWPRPRKWLRRELPQEKPRLDEVDSTAEAARRAALEPGVAAIRKRAGGRRQRSDGAGAQHPGCPREHHALYRAGPCLVRADRQDKTSVVFSVKDRPGVLKDALSAFAEEGSTLPASSRPSRKRAWTYVFFAGLSSHPEEDRWKAPSSPRGALPPVGLIGAYPEVSPKK